MEGYKPDRRARQPLWRVYRKLQNHPGKAIISFHCVNTFRSRSQSPDANATTVTAGKCFLGRPWNDLATTVYLRTFMDDSIEPVGWTPFDSARLASCCLIHQLRLRRGLGRPVIMNTTFYAEFDSTGTRFSLNIAHLN